jgi:SAM-dependent methyltransferase
MKDNSQTRFSFEQKWNSSHDYQIGGSSSFDEDTLGWILTRNGFQTLGQLADHLSGFSVILDAGCGNGRILKLFSELVDSSHNLHGFDYATAEVAKANLGKAAKSVVEADLLDLSSLKDLEAPDFIYCQEVLHHTSDPALAFKNLVNILNPSGEIAIYVYKEKAPIREYTDDFVRNLIESLGHDEAMDLTNDFALFGKALSELDVQVETSGIRVLGIPAGTYQIQRLLYHFFLKCYWNPDLSFKDNNMINFDWYHPSVCSRHTLEEVRGWFKDNDLVVVHECVDEYGITMRGTKLSESNI